VKGLIFNLLDNMAHQSGCADEAWDLVMEFVASETAGEHLSDSCLTACEDGWSGLAFDAPAEAVVQCLGGGGLGERLSGYPELANALDEWARESESLPLQRGDERLNQDLLSLLEQLLAEALADGEREELDERERRTLSPPRGSE
jgi:hypothetical protein